MIGPGGPMMAAPWGGPLGAMMGGPRPPFGGGPGEVKKGLVNDPMANLGGPMGPGGPGPWGPRPPAGPPAMVCISQGVSGKPCTHFNNGKCQYGNKCIHLHMVPNPAAAALGHQPPFAKQGEESDDDDDDDDEEGGGEGAGGQPNAGPGGPGGPMGGGPGPSGPKKSMFEKREEAKSKAFEEAMAAAKAAAAAQGDLSSHLVTEGNRGGGGYRGGGGVNVLGPSVMHAYSVGQKSKKKDPKPEEQRPGDWQCECGNYNF